MKAKSILMKKVVACMLAIVISFCTFTTPVHADLKPYELVDWSVCLTCMNKCEYDFDGSGKNSLCYLPSTELSVLTDFISKNQLTLAYDYLGEIYTTAPHTLGKWKAVNCCKHKIGSTLEQMLNIYVATHSATIIANDTKNWWLLTETIMIVGASTGLIVYKKKKRHSQRS